MDIMTYMLYLIWVYHNIFPYYIWSHLLLVGSVRFKICFFIRGSDYDLKLFSSFHAFLVMFIWHVSIYHDFVWLLLFSLIICFIDDFFLPIYLHVYQCFSIFFIACKSCWVLKVSISLTQVRLSHSFKSVMSWLNNLFL